ncbi:hypothetical protein GS474_05005 [Rhodococcus hoagii]|nr:hypothetical protein [Prescottella equi]
MNTPISFSIVDTAFDAELPTRFVIDLLKTYDGLPLAELARRIRYAAEDRHSRALTHAAVDELIRSGAAEHVTVGGSRVVRLTATMSATAEDVNA